MPFKRYPRQSRQLLAYVFSGGVTAVAHYALLIGLVELGRVDPVPATLAGFVLGAVVSYTLNRWLTFDATHSHVQATWRFALIAAGGFVLTGVLMHLFVARAGRHWSGSRRSGERPPSPPAVIVDHVRPG